MVSTKFIRDNSKAAAIGAFSLSLLYVPVLMRDYSLKNSRGHDTLPPNQTLDKLLVLKPEGTKAPEASVVPMAATAPAPAPTPAQDFSHFFESLSSFDYLAPKLSPSPTDRTFEKTVTEILPKFFCSPDEYSELKGATAIYDRFESDVLMDNTSRINFSGGKSLVDALTSAAIAGNRDALLAFRIKCMFALDTNVKGREDFIFDILTSLLAKGSTAGSSTLFQMSIYSMDDKYSKRAAVTLAESMKNPDYLHEQINLNLLRAREGMIFQQKDPLVRTVLQLEVALNDMIHQQNDVDATLLTLRTEVAQRAAQAEYTADSARQNQAKLNYVKREEHPLEGTYKTQVWGVSGSDHKEDMIPAGARLTAVRLYWVEDSGINGIQLIYSKDGKEDVTPLRGTSDGKEARFDIGEDEYINDIKCGSRIRGDLTYIRLTKLSLKKANLKEGLQDFKLPAAQNVFFDPPVACAEFTLGEGSRNSNQLMMGGDGDFSGVHNFRGGGHVSEGMGRTIGNDALQGDRNFPTGIRDFTDDNIPENIINPKALAASLDSDKFNNEGNVAIGIRTFLEGDSLRAVGLICQAGDPPHSELNKDNYIKDRVRVYQPEPYDFERNWYIGTEVEKQIQSLEYIFSRPAVVQYFKLRCAGTTKFQPKKEQELKEIFLPAFIPSNYVPGLNEAPSLEIKYKLLEDYCLTMRRKDSIGSNLAVSLGKAAVFAGEDSDLAAKIVAILSSPDRYHQSDETLFTILNVMAMHDSKDARIAILQVRAYDSTPFIPESLTRTHPLPFSNSETFQSWVEAIRIGRILQSRENLLYAIKSSKSAIQNLQQQIQIKKVDLDNLKKELSN